MCRVKLIRLKPFVFEFFGSFLCSLWVPALRYVVKALYHSWKQNRRRAGLSQAGGTAVPVSLQALLEADACHDLGSTAGGSVV